MVERHSVRRPQDREQVLVVAALVSPDQMPVTMSAATVAMVSLRRSRMRLSHALVVVEGQHHGLVLAR